MKAGKFMLDGSPFFPMVLNYSMGLQTDGNAIWASPYKGYTPGYRSQFHDKDSALLQLRSDFMLIKELGFNAVRIVKLAEGPVISRSSGEPFLNVAFNDLDTLFPLDNDTVYDRYLSAVEDVLRTARELDLKVILLTSMRPEKRAMEDHWKKIASRFEREPAIMAYDLFNEPLYFDSLERSKKEVYKIVKGWRRLMNEHAPDHLVTIGLQGIREVFTWDPNILDVDFISFHPYEYETEQIRNEMRWYHEQVDVPWIIGETSLPADNDSVPYSTQLEFARKILEQAHNCGACGFSWWQYKDVQWGEFHSDHMGVVDLHRSVQPRGAPLPVLGTPKPVVEAFQEFDATRPRGECVLLPNYANFSEHSISMISGRLLDENGDPIAGGVVIGWNEHWSRSYHTVTAADGTFQLRGDLYFHHWMASATRHSWVRGDVQPSSYLTLGQGMPEMYLGNLYVERLSFARKGYPL